MLEGFNFHTSIKVRYSEIEALMIVFSAHYMNYIEIAIGDYLQAAGVLGGNNKEGCFEVVMAKATVEFKRSACLGDLIDVYVRISRLGRKSFTANFVMVRALNGDLILKAENVYVCFNVVTRLSEPIAEHVREKIWAFEGANFAESGMKV